MATKSAFLIGGSGQVGRAAAARLAADGWQVTIAHRGDGLADPALDAAGVRSAVLDRSDTEALVAAAAGHDLVLDAIAFGPEHGEQLARLAGSVGSLVVISSGSVYLGRNGTYPETATGDHDAPEFPVPIAETWQTVQADTPTYSARKSALERVLLATDDLPVTLLRPGTLHGPHSASLHQWYFIKRALDRRPTAVLARDGKGLFATTSTANVAALVALAALRPGKRVLNIADEEVLTDAEIGRRIYDLMGWDGEITTFAGPPHADHVGFSPWGLAHPVVLDTTAARTELGYRDAVTTEQALTADIEWAVRAVAAADGDWPSVFPAVVHRFGVEPWFPYAAEDAFLAPVTA